MEIKENVRKLLLELKKNMDRHINSDSLVSDGILDSFDIISLVTELEGAFDIEIDPEYVMSENFESVDAIAELVEKCKD